MSTAEVLVLRMMTCWEKKLKEWRRYRGFYAREAHEKWDARWTQDNLRKVDEWPALLYVSD